QMVITAGDLREAGIELPLLVGGAALSDKFTRSKIAPSYAGLTLYAKDAMTGLRLMNEIMDPAQREKLQTSTVTVDTAVSGDGREAPRVAPNEARSSRVRTNIPIPPAPYLDRRVRALPHLAEIWTYINPYMLYGRNMGFKGNFTQALQQRDPLALELFHKMEEVKHGVAQWMKPRAVWQFFETERAGNSIHLFAPGAASPLHTFRFGRQAKPDGLCLSDYILDAEEGGRDHFVLFVVTAGESVRERVEQAKQAGEYFKAHATQALATETAEGCAEWLHRRIREEWGFPDPPSITMQERFTSRYRGKRYSFGYGACPNMDDQQGIWKLLRPEDIGVNLTEGMMMEPEASVSALVFHHPDCAYFSVIDPADGASDS
ncbi:MAG: vitamin B12 dependent-methionine synthase activation domain-containing protein, partial [Candidatus Acidiferrales bacterium]